MLTLTRACTGYDAVEVMAEGYFEGVEGRFSQVRKRGGRGGGGKGLVGFSLVRVSEV